MHYVTKEGQYNLKLLNFEDRKLRWNYDAFNRQRKLSSRSKSSIHFCREIQSAWKQDCFARNAIKLLS